MLVLEVYRLLLEGFLETSRRVDRQCVHAKKVQWGSSNAEEWESGSDGTANGSCLVWSLRGQSARRKAYVLKEGFLFVTSLTGAAGLRLPVFVGVLNEASLFQKRWATLQKEG